MAISQNTALFSLIGTTYGGDGRTTFALPDLRGRVPVHTGHGPGLSAYRQGASSGTESRALAVSNLPPHTHTGQVTPRGASETASEPNPDDNYPAAGPGGRGDETPLYSGNANVEMGPSPFQTNPTGQSIPFDIRQPFTTIRFTMAITGVFPSRS